MAFRIITSVGSHVCHATGAVCALASLSLAYALKSDAAFCTYSRKYGRKAFGNTVRLLYSVLPVAIKGWSTVSRPEVSFRPGFVPWLTGG
ncbi:hypothetical protein DN460_01195 [Enterobacter cloacae]|nr:hypothetical protein DN460_01195 [Enterobacter cloacae]